MVNRFKTLRPDHRCYWLTIGSLTVLAIVGLAAAHYMDTEGHWVTGMNNQVVWGLPHVLAITLILAASGALNVASMASLFSKAYCESWSRLSGLLAISLLLGGLMILVLDLGRPDRLAVAMTHYNFRSIFAWNIFLYTGFIIVVVGYLWTMFERQFNIHTKRLGLLAFCWRFVLTAGTGAIFGFLVARDYYHTAIMVPLFIVLSLMLGMAVFIYVAWVVSGWSGNRITDKTLSAMVRLLGIMIALEVFLVGVFHLAGLYAASHRDIERFILFEGGIYTILFWVGQIFVGSFMPLAIIGFTRWCKTAVGIWTVCLSVVAGVVCHLYVTIIAGQAYPQVLFPGKQVSSTFFDGVVADYCPGKLELMLGLGGVAVAGIVLFGAMRVLPFMPVQEHQES